MVTALEYNEELFREKKEEERFFMLQNQDDHWVKVIMQTEPLPGTMDLCC